MFRSVLKNKQYIVNRFNNHNFPLFIWCNNFSSEFESKKKITPVWKDTNGNGKSIYECENESWVQPPGEKLSRTYKKRISIENEELETFWIESTERED